jgi:hypothetical protein
MLDQIDGGAPERRGIWQTGPLEYPLGRGINFELVIDDFAPVLARLSASGVRLFFGPEERWYRVGDHETGVRQALVQDPDGYLVRLQQDIGIRQVALSSSHHSARVLSQPTITIALTPSERHLLRSGLIEWGGPARCTDDLARVIGFADVEALLRDGYQIAARLDNAEPLTRQDWQRALVATEFVFASNTFGSGLDWEITTGLSDTETIVLLRAVQKKLLRALTASS